MRLCFTYDLAVTYIYREQSCVRNSDMLFSDFVIIKKLSVSVWVLLFPRSNWDTNSISGASSLTLGRFGIFSYYFAD